jgi:quercetin dioxygenase-like cupin family protein
MDTTLIIKSKPLTLIDAIDYVPHAIVSKTFIKKPTGDINIMSFDKGEGLKKITSPFDFFIHIIDGVAEIIIDGTSHTITAGQVIIAPAHLSREIKSIERFTILSVVVKSGYE